LILLLCLNNCGSVITDDPPKLNFVATYRKATE